MDLFHTDTCLPRTQTLLESVSSITWAAPKCWKVWTRIYIQQYTHQIYCTMQPRWVKIDILASSPTWIGVILREFLINQLPGAFLPTTVGHPMCWKTSTPAKMRPTSPGKVVLRSCHFHETSPMGPRGCDQRWSTSDVLVLNLHPQLGFHLGHSTQQLFAAWWL